MRSGGEGCCGGGGDGAPDTDALDQAGNPITAAIDVFYHAATSLSGNEEVGTIAVTTDASG